MSPRAVPFLDAIASPSTYPCHSVTQSVIDSFRLEIAIASPSFASDLSVPKSLVINISTHLFEIVFRMS